MAHILTTARIMVATISFIAVVSAPFVIMNTKPTTATSGYGLELQQFDRADAAIVANS